MRTKQVLSIVMMVGFAFGHKAFAAGDFYEYESTNEWFKVIAKDANLDDQTHWQTPTNEDNSAEVVDSVIKLDTDLDDPLTYTATEHSTSVVMVVNARFTATANKVRPSLEGEKPQAAITVVADGNGTNWWGLVGGVVENDGWVKFVNEIPEIGQEYDVRIEFDFRESQKKIRYVANGKILKAGDDDGWYANPKNDPSFISSVAFAGAGDIGDFAGSNIVWRATPIVDVDFSEGAGFDYTNGTIKVTATVREAGTATLKVIDFATGEVVEREVAIGADTTEVGWDISDVIDGSLVPGATYGYEVTMEAGGQTVTETGTFVSAGENPVNWFHADATGDVEDVAGGEWANTPDFPKPEIENNAYVIDDAAKFNVTDRSKGTNEVVVIDTHVAFEGLSAISSLEVEQDALGGFVAATNDSGPVWMALVPGDGEPCWSALSGAPAPEVSVGYVVRAEVSFLEGYKQVRYLVKRDVDGADFVVLNLGDKQWIKLLDDKKDVLESIELKGSGRVAKFTANITERALAEVGSVKYYTMAEAMAAGGDITLLTNVTVKPTGAGTWKFTNKGDYQVFVDLSSLPEGASYTWSQDGTLTVSIAVGATYLIW